MMTKTMLYRTMTTLDELTPEVSLSGIVEKLAKYLLETGKIRLNFNVSDVETILQLHEDLDDFDKKIQNLWPPSEALPNFPFRRTSNGTHWIGTSQKGPHECWISCAISEEEPPHRSNVLSSTTKIPSSGDQGHFQQKGLHISLQINAERLPGDTASGNEHSSP